MGNSIIYIKKDISMKWISSSLHMYFCSVNTKNTLLKKINSHTLLVTQMGIKLFDISSPTHKLQGGFK